MPSTIGTPFVAALSERLEERVNPYQHFRHAHSAFALPTGNNHLEDAVGC